MTHSNVEECPLLNNFLSPFLILFAELVSLYASILRKRTHRRPYAFGYSWTCLFVIFLFLGLVVKCFCRSLDLLSDAGHTFWWFWEAASLASSLWTTWEQGYIFVITLSQLWASFYDFAPANGFEVACIRRLCFILLLVGRLYCGRGSPLLRISVVCDRFAG